MKKLIIISAIFLALSGCDVYEAETPGGAKYRSLKEKIEVEEAIEIQRWKEELEQKERKREEWRKAKEPMLERELIEIKEKREEFIKQSNGTLRDKSAQQVKKLVDSWKEGYGWLFMVRWEGLEDLGRRKEKEFYEIFSEKNFYKVFGKPERKQFLSGFAGFERDSYYFIYNCKDGLVRIEVDASELDEKGIVSIRQLNIF